MSDIASGATAMIIAQQGSEIKSLKQTIKHQAEIIDKLKECVISTHWSV